VVLVVASVASEAVPRRGTPEYEAYLRQVERITGTHPVRREGPLRYENITDVEVREIEAAARDVVPRAIVNISGVTVGCPCEDGPLCTDQVWIVAYRPDKSVGLLLSKIDAHWIVGPVQKWWLAYDDLDRRNYKSFTEYLEAEQKMFDAFPACVAPRSAGSSPNNALEQTRDE
jgi:hypothetical protein